MKNKLVKFTEFANSLYPHELDYLLSVQNFEKADNLKILNLINYNSKNPEIKIPYDPTIDKRKYTYLKNWITKNLEYVDVDLFYNWLIGIEKQVMTDAILPDEENAILEKAKTVNYSHYYFLRFYELMEKYRDYLLIRMRTRYYQPVSDYLEQYQEYYQRGYELNQDLNQATLEIIKQHEETKTETKQWEQLLSNTYLNEKIDGYTRYRAVVRLTFLFYNYRNFDNLRQINEHLDKLLKTNVFYSKRILANYYANRAMMHSKLNELEKAEKYGYLSIRQKNSDYLFYLLNLTGVLLRSEKQKDAYWLMKNSIPDLKNTASYYYKIGFAAFYIRTLVANKYHSKAVSYAETFIEAYKREVFKHRWHLFFSAYVQALFKNEDYQKILNLDKRHKLVEKEQQSIGEARYMPVIAWRTKVAEFIEGHISESNLIDSLVISGKELIKGHYKTLRIKELLTDLSPASPAIFKIIIKDLAL